jgi:hypothetical protein
LFRVDAGLDADGVAGLRGVHGGLDRRMAREMALAGDVSIVDIPYPSRGRRALGQ